MLLQPTLERLYALRLSGMAEALRRQQEDPGAAELSFEERFGLLVESQWTWKETRSLAKLKQQACQEDIDFRHPRGLERGRWMSVVHESGWVRRKQNVVLTGPTGVGKSYLACALAQQACRDGFNALYTRAPQLFRDLQAARAQGSLARLLAKLARLDVLVVDDFVIAPMAELERRDFLDVCDDRYRLRSTVLTSQLPPDRWHELVGDPTLADSILDRMVHNAHRFDLRGESLRKVRDRAEIAETAGGAA